MKLNKFIALLAILVWQMEAKAQLSSGNEQFIFNPVNINPSVAGMHHNQIKLGFDARWVGLDGAPQTGFLNFDKMFNQNTGWNVAVMSDRIGPISTIAIANAFAFHINVTEASKLSFGLKHHLTHSSLNLNNNRIFDPNDPALTMDRNGIPVNNFDASIAYSNSDRFFVGVSYRNLIAQPRFRFVQSNVEPILSAQGWYRQEFGGDAALEAFAVISSSTNQPLNAQIGAMGTFQNKVGLGLNFSPVHQIGIFAYLKLTEKFNVFYNYNMPISDIAQASKQSHGIGLSYRIGNESLKGNSFFLQPTNESSRTRMF
ncbi:MAG: PorP/SprF family type IX secretion system membrane protein [Bacteroidia bacterium]|nr:PorP/SprF family type IX secretion system membrane protein [Bacteroidia bacterium]